MGVGLVSSLEKLSCKTKKLMMKEKVGEQDRRERVVKVNPKLFELS